MNGKRAKQLRTFSRMAPPVERYERDHLSGSAQTSQARYNYQRLKQDYQGDPAIRKSIGQLLMSPHKPRRIKNTSRARRRATRQIIQFTRAT